jgi:hypothetical protein
MFQLALSWEATASRTGTMSLSAGFCSPVLPSPLHPIIHSQCVAAHTREQDIIIIIGPLMIDAHRLS